MQQTQLRQKQLVVPYRVMEQMISNYYSKDTDFFKPKLERNKFRGALIYLFNTYRKHFGQQIAKIDFLISNPVK